MESKFIEITLLNIQNDKLRTKAWVRADQIIQVIRPTDRDLAQIKEMGAIIQFVGGALLRRGNSRMADGTVGPTNRGIV